VIAGRSDFGKGSPANPMSFEEVADKFLGCAEFAEWPGDKAERVVDLVRKLEDLPDVRTLTALCSNNSVERRLNVRSLEKLQDCGH
jgi:hypothetical protein